MQLHSVNRPTVVFTQSRFDHPVLLRFVVQVAAAGYDGPVAMTLNGAALESLEVLENSSGGSAGSLAALLDHATTPFGRRRLRKWLTRPLYRVEDIRKRQDAVEVRGRAGRGGVCGKGRAGGGMAGGGMAGRGK